MKKNNCVVCLIEVMLLVFTPAFLTAQSLPKVKTYSNFKCEVFLEIYNGFYDWVGDNDYSGRGKPLSSGSKTALGAIAVANKNDTDGDGIVDGLGDSDVRPGFPALGRNEIDLIKIVVKKVDPGALLSGNVELKITGGSVKIWTQPWKGSEITLPYIFSASQLDKTLYLEILEESTYRGIEIEAIYNGKSDKANATGVWTELTRYWRENSALPIPNEGTLANLNEERLVKAINNRWISLDGNRYGHGDFYRGIWDGDNANHDKRFGGRILFEFSIYPLEAVNLIDFDVTRQRKTRTAKNYYAASPDFNLDIESKDFPNEATENKDNELPNDDMAAGDEDNTPTNGFIYSADPPATNKKVAVKYDDLSGSLTNSNVAFIVSKNSFREFVRVKLKGSGGFPYNNQNQVLGSRASHITEWHCVYYAKRSNDAKTFTGDYTTVSSSIPLKYSQTYIGDGTAVVTDLASNATTDVFFLQYAATENTWFLSNFIGEGLFSDAQAADGSWTVTLNGVTVQIHPGSTPFQDEFTWVFNTFRTSAPAGVKLNVIDKNSIDPTTAY